MWCSLFLGWKGSGRLGEVVFERLEPLELRRKPRCEGEWFTFLGVLRVLNRLVGWWV